MKKYFNLFIALFSVVLLTGCGKKDSVKTPEELISLNGSSVLQKTSDYNGVYEINYETSTKTYTFKGFIEIKDDKINFSYSDLGSTSVTIENKYGYCGYYNENGEFYIVIKTEYSNRIYSCIKNGANLECQTNLDSDLFGYYLSKYEKQDPIKLIKIEESFEDNVNSLNDEMKQKSVQNQKANEERAKELEEYMERSKYDIEVDAVTISNVYYNNALDGNKQYFGKRIKTIARFEEAEKGYLTGWNVTFNTDGIYDYYCSTFKSGEENSFSEYNRGETLIIYATVDELVGSYINLKECDIER